MSESKFEQFIKEHSASFESETPHFPLNLEKNFESRLRKEKSIQILGKTTLCLAVVLIFTRFYFTPIQLEQADYDFLEEVYADQENAENDYDYYSMLPTD